MTGSESPQTTIVGMSAVFAAATRAPITAVLIVFEMSNDYKLILPLMLASVIATVLAEYLFPESIYTLNLRKKGIHLRHGRDYDLMHGVRVREVMTTDPFVVSCDMPATKLRESFRQTNSHGFPVVDAEGNLAGVVSLRDYQEAIKRDDAADLYVRDIATMDRILLAFERAEQEPDPEKRRAWLTFVVVGGGPTGVELAGVVDPTQEVRDRVAAELHQRAWHEALDQHVGSAPGLRTYGSQKSGRMKGSGAHFERLLGETHVLTGQRELVMIKDYVLHDIITTNLGKPKRPVFFAVTSECIGQVQVSALPFL